MNEALINTLAAYFDLKRLLKNWRKDHTTEIEINGCLCTFTYKTDISRYLEIIERDLHGIAQTFRSN